MIINFWASWCDPCVEEFPSFLKLLDHFKGRIKILAISADNNKEDIETFIKAFNGNSENLIVMWDKEQKVAKSFGTRILPESYIIGLNNKFVRKVTGIDNWYTPQAIEFFENLLTKK